VAPAEEADEAARLMDELMSGKSVVGGPFTLADPSGRKRSLAEFRGKVVILYFGYTFCPDVCPTDLAQIARAVRDQGAREHQVQPIFITLDPARDTPELLRRYAAAFHPRLLALRGSEAETRRIARAYKVFYEKVPAEGSGGYAVNHVAFAFVLDRQGKYLAFVPPGTPSGRTAELLREALAAP
jgi:protein SCO1/2